MQNYICRCGDTFDLIALALYGDDDYANVLIEANPQYSRQLHFYGGEILEVPDLIQTGSTTAPWTNGGR